MVTCLHLVDPVLDLMLASQVNQANQAKPAANCLMELKVGKIEKRDDSLRVVIIIFSVFSQNSFQ